jgi:hypothetical protein
VQAHVRIAPLGREKVKTATGWIDANHYRYSGDVTKDQWFDDRIHFAGMSPADRFARLPDLQLLRSLPGDYCRPKTAWAFLRKNFSRIFSGSFRSLVSRTHSSNESIGKLVPNSTLSWP